MDLSFLPASTVSWIVQDTKVSLVSESSAEWEGGAILLLNRLDHGSCWMFFALSVDVMCISWFETARIAANRLLYWTSSRLSKKPQWHEFHEEFMFTAVSGATRTLDELSAHPNSTSAQPHLAQCSWFPQFLFCVNSSCLSLLSWDQLQLTLSQHQLVLTWWVPLRWRATPFPCQFGNFEACKPST